MCTQSAMDIDVAQPADRFEGLLLGGCHLMTHV